MKLIKSFILSFCVLLGTSCTLDLQEDPNAVQPNQMLPGSVLNSMQRSLAGLFNGASTNGMLITRLQNSGGSTYSNIFSPQSFDGTWQTAYSGILEDADGLIKQADATGLARHAGMARVISAYTLMLLVDSFGDVPFSNAFKGSANFNPAVDNMSDLYMNTIIPMLDKAIADLTTATVVNGGYLNATAPTVSDLYYGGNFTRWARLANTLKLKAYLNLRLTNASAATTGINAVIADPIGIISTQTENFVFRYGTNSSDPDSRHPRFAAQYPAGGSTYMSNWLMWHMFHGYGATQNGQPGDPRMRFYFYRQTNTNSADPNQIRCVTGTTPAHYPRASGGAILDHPLAGRPPLGIVVSNDATSPAWGRTFCYPSDRGYWGRDHVNNEGIPPDNLLRTAWGAYPSGGRFDANVNTGVSASVGMRGAGIQPILMRCYVDFMLAEAALYLGIVPPGANNTARLRFENGIRNSMTDVRDWTVNGNYGNAMGNGSAVVPSPNEGGTVTTFYPNATYAADVNNYVTAALASYDNQLTVSVNSAMNYVAREFWISSFGNGIEAYNLYRRTGMPTGMQPALNDAPGAFPRSFWYPANFATLNSSGSQKADLTQRIFWDTNASNLDF